MNPMERVARELAGKSTVRSETGVFVRKEGALAVVNIGASTVTIPAVGFYPPLPGMVVQVEWRDGRPVITGPAVPLNPVGVITTVGSPQAGVTVDGVDYTMFYRDGYTPQSGDTVTINWASLTIEGKVSGHSEPEAPETTAPTTEPFTLKVKASASGRYQSSWWGSEPWASNNNDGIWTYGNRVRDAIKGADITRVEIYLPLTQKLGNCSIGTHPHASIPSGAPSISNTVNLPSGERSGWVVLPLSFATYLAAGGRGIGVTTDIGLNKWRSVGQDSDSGALRFTGTR